MPTEGAAEAVTSTPDETAPISLADYDYVLPPERIAQEPIEPRDRARLLVVPRGEGTLEHRIFHELPDLLEPDDLLVLNETRVTAVRLFGERNGGGEVEILLLRPAPEVGPDRFEALVRPGKKVRDNDVLLFEEARLRAEAGVRTPDGGRILRFFSVDGGDVAELLTAAGRTPLPPYITRPLANPERYQTVYARIPGSAAAPTAGLHFTPELLDRLRQAGIRTATVRLDVGLGTFRPIRTDDVRNHEMHEESFSVPEETAERVNTCRGRVIAVGTTTLRALETAARNAPEGMRVTATEGLTRLFVLPGFRFRATDGLITNFHQPHSTLLLLVAAFVGRDQMRAAYTAALTNPYRFLSFGDAMLAVTRGTV
ncbi:MAG: tRNA preQ1(34) S-adenosylmethionine ribosyltransferase-isomerase QueA [Capsulimonadales bacterium]|nr:tRNA preQ1(34) S-adenosylmethionine ribosyltransferase-isomerase QueA [Capsulimonadales bacterium]